MFGWDFEVDAWSRFWRWNLIKICVWVRDMTSRSYFGKMNSILGSVVPLAMFFINFVKEMSAEVILFTWSLWLQNIETNVCIILGRLAVPFLRASITSYISSDGAEMVWKLSTNCNYFYPHSWLRGILIKQQASRAECKIWLIFLLKIIIVFFRRQLLVFGRFPEKRKILHLIFNFHSMHYASKDLKYLKM